MSVQNLSPSKQRMNGDGLQSIIKFNLQFLKLINVNWS